VKIEQLEMNRYLSYTSIPSALEGDKLQTFILDAITSAKPKPNKPITQSNNRPLVQLEQLKALKRLLGLTTDS
jgi:hypothetical protein